MLKNLFICTCDSQVETLKLPVVVNACPVCMCVCVCDTLLVTPLLDKCRDRLQSSSPP